MSAYDLLGPSHNAIIYGIVICVAVLCWRRATRPARPCQRPKFTPMEVHRAAATVRRLDHDLESARDPQVVQHLLDQREAYSRVLRQAGATVPPLYAAR